MLNLESHLDYSKAVAYSIYLIYTSIFEFNISANTVTCLDAEIVAHLVPVARPHAGVTQRLNKWNVRPEVLDLSHYGGRHVRHLRQVRQQLHRLVHRLECLGHVSRFAESSDCSGLFIHCSYNCFQSDTPVHKLRYGSKSLMSFVRLLEK